MGFESGLPKEVYSSISKHPAMVEAYYNDLTNLLDGNGPDGTKLDIDDEYGAVIVNADGNKLLYVKHYVPEENGGDGYVTLSRPEEPFAEIFDNVTDPDRTMDTNNLSKYFPAMTKEVEGIVNALNMAYYNEPYMKPENNQKTENNDLTTAQAYSAVGPSPL